MPDTVESRHDEYANDILSPKQANLNTLLQELEWLGKVINIVIASYLKHEGHEQHWLETPPPIFNSDSSVYASLINEWQLNTYERLCLALALAPHLKPEALDIFFGVNQLTDRGFTEFGGIADKTFSGFLPTGQTLIFLIAGNDPLWRTDAELILSPVHRFATEQMITLENGDRNLPRLSGTLTLSEQWLHYFLTGEKVRPELSAAFPAAPITTPLSWPDLVLDYNVMVQVEEIRSWLRHGQKLMRDWGLENKVKPGFRAVFYGPPGTGKTLTAALLAKSTGREIYRVDLSMIVSKYIGETEKNLSRVFDVASNKDWILFFDEADALFGKRTAATTSNDRHANQQTGYLLQRIEDFPGTVILATNLKTNMDDAFTRRFQTMINFSMPSPAQRLQLWQKAFDGVCDLAEDVDLKKISQNHELAGGAIINVLRQCALTAISRDSRTVMQADLIDGIRRELRKDNKTIRVN
ncbi:MAG: AAA family ATPase [Alteromonadaceae bacterium]|nr:MAG: AAA family ATPase [Alteromonadaceae bacterium]